jgi:hypothetical protein
MSTTADPHVTEEVTLEEIKAIIEEAERRPLDPAERERLWKIAVSYFAVLAKIEDQKSTIRTLRELVFGAKTETKENVVGGAAAAPTGTGAPEKAKAGEEKAQGPAPVVAAGRPLSLRLWRDTLP